MEYAYTLIYACIILHMFNKNVMNKYRHAHSVTVDMEHKVHIPECFSTIILSKPEYLLNQLMPITVLTGPDQI